MPIQLPAQGLRDFESFEEYLKEWIQPCLLGDLRTLSEISKHHENLDVHGDRPFGACNFMLFTNLMTATDHLGYLLQGNPEFGGKSSINIKYFLELNQFGGGRYKEVSSILAIFGRNSVVHSAWPITMFKVQNYYFGLGVSVDPGGKRHLTLELLREKYKKRHEIQETDVYKLFVNVYSYFKDLDDFCFEELDPTKYEDSFKKLKETDRISIESPLKTSKDIKTCAEQQIRNLIKTRGQL